MSNKKIIINLHYFYFYDKETNQRINFDQYKKRCLVKGNNKNEACLLMDGNKQLQGIKAINETEDYIFMVGLNLSNEKQKIVDKNLNEKEFQLGDEEHYYVPNYFLYNKRDFVWVCNNKPRSLSIKSLESIMKKYTELQNISRGYVKRKDIKEIARTYKIKRVTASYLNPITEKENDDNIKLHDDSLSVYGDSTVSITISNKKGLLSSIFDRFKKNDKEYYDNLKTLQAVFDELELPVNFFKEYLKSTIEVID